MKKIIFTALTICCATFTAVHATSVNKSVSIVITNEGEETAVKPEELPQPVKTTLLSDPYKEWKVTSASLVRGEKEYYKIELLKGSEKKTITLNNEGHEVKHTKDGKKVEHKDAKDVHKN